jgi:hypothetical protein
VQGKTCTGVPRITSRGLPKTGQPGSRQSHHEATRRWSYWKMLDCTRHRATAGSGNSCTYAVQDTQVTQNCAHCIGTFDNPSQGNDFKAVRSKRNCCTPPRNRAMLRHVIPLHYLLCARSLHGMPGHVGTCRAVRRWLLVRVTAW